MRDLDDITAAIIDYAIQIHRDLGPGLLESGYEALLADALVMQGLHVERQAVVRFEHNGLVFEEGFRVALLINFGGNTLMDALRRVVNDLPPSASPRLRVNQSP